MTAKDSSLLNSNLKENEQLLIDWLAFSLARGLKPVQRLALIRDYETPRKVFEVSDESLLKYGLDHRAIKQLRNAEKGFYSGRAAEELERCLAWLSSPGNGIVPFNSEEYPDLLTEIPDPPLILFCRGRAEILGLPAIAIVGSRNPTVDGRRTAKRFASELCRAGFAVTSGLAFGIDAESHEGALSAGGKTVAVLGTGIDQCYPAVNRPLFDRVAQEGVLVSEFIPGIPPTPANFPRRNRIISGLSIGVLVVEAGMKSGSMITARLALEQGREVFAVPGSINNPVAKGCHRLISQGAKLVQQIEDIAEELGALLAFVGDRQNVGRYSCVDKQSRAPDELQGYPRRLHQAIGIDPVSLDTLLAETGMELGDAIAALTELELVGLVRREPAGYVRQQGD